jgi:hypothetical protein
MSINSNQIIKKPDVVIDPNFFLPPGVVDARYPNETEITTEEISLEVDADEILDIEASEEDMLEPDESGDNDVSILQPPDNVVVVSQTTRFDANGRQVVDVVLEVLDVDESIQVDVRMTKA